MTDKLKDIIANAEQAHEGFFYREFLIIPKGTKYDGIWGINGFDEMLILAGELETDKWAIVTDYSDAFNIINCGGSINFDVPSKYDCLRIWFDAPIELTSITSSVLSLGHQFGEEDSK